MELFFCILGIIGNILVLISIKKKSTKIAIIGIVILYLSLSILAFLLNSSITTFDFDRPILSEVVSEEDKWPSLPY